MARIGLLEDNLSIAKVCATMLGYAGHKVVVYANARECLQALCNAFREQPSSAKGCTGENVLPIDALILDLHLPTVPGLEVLRLLRTSPRTCTLPLIFCTAATPSEINLAFTIAPDATLIEKPFKLEALIAAVSDSLPASLQPRR